MSDIFTPGNGDDLPFEFRKQPVPAEKKQENWNDIEGIIIKQEAPVYQIMWRRNIMIAASLLLLLCAGVWYLQSNRSLDTNLYTTDFAQVKNIILPDGSKVTLNANSQLKLSVNWGEKGDRQVWLDGEAYFEVEKKLSTHQKFIVHTKDIDVEVLGTKFNVNTRHEKAVVSLEEGKIKLSLNGSVKEVLKKKYRSEIIEMKPGDIVKLDTVSGINLATDPNINFHSGWARNEFHFGNTSLKEIAVMIKDVYGYTVETDDEQLLQLPVNGDLRAANLQELVDVLQQALRLKMTVEKKTIKISHL